jgi:endonuclease/exonuclease/phosphatase family metal-dependent hydrolase
MKVAVPYVAGEIMRRAGGAVSERVHVVVTGDMDALELGRRIDYIFVRCTDHGPTLHVSACRRLFDAPIGGIWASDHFGLTADLSALTPTGRLVP